MAAITVMAAAALFASAVNTLDIENGDATTVGIYIKDLATGRVVFEENSSLALTPASVTKTVTTASALITLGPDFRFTTTVALAGHRSATVRSRWEGDIVIYSSGDPTTGSSEFDITGNISDSVIAGVSRLGITEITGSVAVVQTMRDAGPIPTWECEDIAWSYGAGLYGFNYCGNTVSACPAKKSTTPPSSIDINCVYTDGSRTDMIRGINSTQLIIYAPAKARRRKNWAVNTTNPNPAATYITVLSSKLRAAGVKTGSKRVTSGVPEAAVEVCVLQSPTAAEICRNLMKRSDNLFAEGMLRAIDPEGTREDCIKAVQDLWLDNGLNSKATIMNDGSGLTRSNRFSPRFLGALLEYMAKSPLAEVFTDCFPVAGIDGTLKNFGARSALKGRLAMKTGSISSVQTYAGYRLDPEGKPTHVVVVMVNGFFCPRKTLQQQIEKFLLGIFNS